MIEYVGIKTAEEAEQVRQRFVKEVEEYNNDIIKDRNRVWIIVTIVAIAIAVALCVFHYDSRIDLALDDWPLGSLALIYLAINFFLTIHCSDAMLSDALWASPASYRYFDATKDMTILKSEIRFNEHSGRKDVWLTLKNSNNEVSHEVLRGFKSITKTDIKDTVIDLDREVIYVPYRDLEN